MKCNGILFSAAFFAATCFANTDLSLYAKPDFETYQPILDRMPFGAPPDPNASPTTLTAADARKEQLEKEKLAKQINMSALNITPDGRTAIGFTDLSAKPPANYYLAVGESSDGWTVLEADYDTDTATVEKEGIEITLQLGKGLIEPASPLGGGRPALSPFPAQTAVAAAAQLNATPSAPAERSLPPGLRRGPPSASTAGATAPAGRPAGTSSYRDRLNTRVEAQQVEKDEAERKQKETLERLAAAAAQDAIRKKQQEEAEEREDGADDIFLDTSEE